jgi:hypothetical protein
VSGQSFVLTGQLRLWLNLKSDAHDGKTNLDNLFDASVVDDLPEDDICSPPNETSVLIFSILLHLGIKHLFGVFQSRGISDSYLPLSVQDIQSIVGPLEKTTADKLLEYLASQNNSGDFILHH